MVLFGGIDETVGGVGAGVVVGGLATLLGLILRDSRGREHQAASQWKTYGLTMAKKYEDCVIAHTASDIDKNAKLLEQAEEIGRLTAEVAALRERLK